MSNNTLKVVLVGDSSVGKTSLFLRMKGDDFVKEQQATVGGSCSMFTVETDKGLVELNMWDTAGQERFRTIVPMYFRKAAVILLVCDITQRTSFSSIPKWIDTIRDNAPSDATLIIVGNKCDLRNENSIGIDELINVGEQYNALIAVETSALSGFGIDALKEQIAELAFAPSADKESDKKIIIKENTEKKNTCCF